jgi:hypothetical protein
VCRAARTRSCSSTLEAWRAGCEEREEQEKRRKQEERENREDQIDREILDEWKPERNDS